MLLTFQEHLNPLSPRHTDVVVWMRQEYGAFLVPVGCFVIISVDNNPLTDTLQGSKCRHVTSFLSFDGSSYDVLQWDAVNSIRSNHVIPSLTSQTALGLQTLEKIPVLFTSR